LTILFNNLSPGLPLDLGLSTSYSMHFFTKSSSFRSTWNTNAAYSAVIPMLCHLYLISLSAPYMEICLSLTPEIHLTILISARWSAASFFFPHRPGLTSTQHTASHTTNYLHDYVNIVACVMYLMTSASVWVSEGNIITTACALAILRLFSSDHTALTLAAAQAVVLATKKVKVAHPRLPSVGFRSWSLFLTVSLQVTWVINPAVGCHYFPPGLQLPPQPLRGLLPILFGEQMHSGCEQFA